jgi:hypothetical protein
VSADDTVTISHQNNILKYTSLSDVTTSENIVCETNVRDIQLPTVSSNINLEDKQSRDTKNKGRCHVNACQRNVWFYMTLMIVNIFNLMIIIQSNTNGVCWRLNIIVNCSLGISLCAVVLLMKLGVCGKINCGLCYQ